MAEEIKSFKVHPDYESQEITFRQKCGWEFVSTQEIYNKDTHLESSIFTDTVTSVTETTHYVKVTFKRDRTKINPRIIEIEDELEKLSVPEKEPYGCNLIGLLAGDIPGFLICDIAAIVLVAISMVLENLILLCIAVVVGSIGTMITKNARKKRIDEEYYAAKEYYENKFEALMRELNDLQ